MARPRLLDLFCGAGGAAVGYHRAGFDVVGVDIKPQPRYPSEFVEADALTFPLDGFDAVHASPPCQDHSTLSSRSGKHGTGWMLTATLDGLRASGLPWVVENVETAAMPGSLVLCGTEFGLRSGDRWLRRHRRFLASFPLWGAGGCSCRKARIGGVYGTGGGGPMTRGFKFDRARAAEALGIDWMTLAELSQAIPPAYTEHIGGFLLDHLREAA
jgi:DNA (cytosine-5)-methyltransferase 1